jgi:hypothetical protein
MDFGDLIFFVIFVLIIIANIVKQIKKTQRQSSAGKPEDQGQAKKAGWKKVLEDMLEEASRQLEEKTSSEPENAPVGRSSGWEQILPESAFSGPVKKKESESRPVETPRQKPLIREGARRKDATPRPKKPAFQPECMHCGAAMKAIRDLGVPDQSGLVYCDACGEQHKYRIVDGQLKLQRAYPARKSAIPAETSYEKIARPPTGVRPHASVLSAEGEAAGGSMDSGIYRRLSRQGLQNAVVWAEILGKPLGLRDLEI